MACYGNDNEREVWGDVNEVLSPKIYREILASEVDLSESELEILSTTSHHSE